MEGATKTLEKFYEALADGDVDDACDLQTESYTEASIEEWNSDDFGRDVSSCKELIQAGLALAKAFAMKGEDFVPSKIDGEMDGDHVAYLTTESDVLGEKETSVTRMVYADGGWLIDGEDDTNMPDDAPEAEGDASRDEDDTDEPTQVDVEIVESGFGQGGDYVQGIVVVTTDDEAAVGESVTVSVNFLDAGGKILATEEQVESFSWAGQMLVMPVWGDLSDQSKAKVATIDPSVSISDYGMGEEAQPELPALQAGEIKAGEYGGFQASFEFTNEGDSDLDSMRVGVVCKDAQGTIIGGGSTYPDAHTNKTIRIDADLTVSKKPTTCTAYLNYPA